jgi:hypothetical protein
VEMLTPAAVATSFKLTGLPGDEFMSRCELS